MISMDSMHIRNFLSKFEITNYFGDLEHKFNVTKI